MKKKMFTVVKTINDVNVLISNDGSDNIPIRPVCDALGIDYKTQYEKICDDELYNSVVGLRPTTASDKKVYNMVNLPFEYAMMWLGSINPKNVKEEAQEFVRMVRSEIVKALSFYFREYKRYVADKQNLLEAKLRELEGFQREFKNTKQKVDKCKKELNLIRSMDFEQWRWKQNQMVIEYPEVDEYEIAETEEV